MVQTCNRDSVWHSHWVDADLEQNLDKNIAEGRQGYLIIQDPSQWLFFLGLIHKT